MNRNLKIITINGFRGVVMAIFIIFGLISGFIISPGWVCMKLWNFLIVDYTSFAPMNLYQGVLLWAVAALSLYALNNKRALIGFGSYPKLTPEQIKDIMNRAKMSDTKIMSEIDALKKELRTESVDNNQPQSQSRQESEKQ